MSHCRSIPIGVTIRYVKLSIDTSCLTSRYVKLSIDIYCFDQYHGRYKALYNILLKTPVGLSTTWSIEYRYILYPVIGWNCRWIPISLPNRSRGIGMSDTLEKKVVRGVSVQQQQQLSIELLTNLSIKTSTRYYRKSAVLKQKASRSR